MRLLSNGEIRTSPQDQQEKEERDEAERRFRRSAISSRREESKQEEREDVEVGKKRVETLVVADKKFIEKHKYDERSITIYILTIMNMVLDKILSSVYSY